MLRQLSKFVSTGSSTRYYLPSVSKVLGGQENYNSRQFSKTTNKLTIRRNGLVPEIGIRTETRRLSFIKKIICSSPKQKKPTKDDEYCCISKQEYCRLKRLDKQKAEAEKNKNDQKCPDLKTSEADCTLREGCKMCKKKMESVSSKAKKLLSMKKNKEVVKCNKKKKEPKKESRKDSKKTSKKDPCAKRPSGKGKEKESFDPCKNPFNQKESDINAFKDKNVDKNADDKKAKTDSQKKEEQKKPQQDENVPKEDKCAKKKEKKASNPCKKETAPPKTGDSKEVKDVEKKDDCQSDEKLDKLVKPAESKTCDKAAESPKAKEACDKCSEELCLEEKPSNVIMPKKENDGCKQLNLALVPVPQSQLKKDACGKKKSALVGIIRKGKEWAVSKSSSKDQNKNLKLMKQVEKEEMSLNEEKRALLQKKKRMSEERQLVEVEKSLCDEETSQFEKEKKIFTSEKKMLSDLKRCIEQCEAEERKNKSGKS